MEPRQQPDTHDESLLLSSHLPPVPQDEPAPATLSRLDREAFKTASREERTEQIRQTLDHAFAQLAEDLRAGKSESLMAYLKAMSHFHSYSFNNCMLIVIQNPQATYVAGYRAWNKLNRYVRRGEEGIVVMAPVTKVVGKREEVQPDGSRKEVPVRRVVNTKPVYVFDISQTDGEDLPTYTGAGARDSACSGDPGPMMERLVKLYAKHEIELEYVDALPGGALGVSKKGAVSVVSGLAPAEEFLVLVHELAHELLHRDAERRKETTQTVRELEAEAVAFVVGYGVGLNTGTASSDYIQLYGGDAELLAESLEAIRGTASRILTVVSVEGG